VIEFYCFWNHSAFKNNNFQTKRTDSVDEITLKLSKHAVFCLKIVTFAAERLLNRRFNVYINQNYDEYGNSNQGNTHALRHGRVLPPGRTLFQWFAIFITFKKQLLQ